MTPWRPLHIASGLCEHVKYLALSLLSHAPPRITTSRCSSSRETLVTSRSRPRRSSRQTQPCLLRSMPSAAVCRRATTRRSSNVPAVHPTTHQVCKAYLHFIPPLRHVDYKRETLPSTRPSTRRELLRTASLRLPLSTITAAARSLFALPCHGSVAAASLQSQARAHICRTARSRLAMPTGWSLPHGDDSCAR